MEGFDVGIDKQEIVIDAVSGGETFKLAHVVKTPTTKQWIEYSRRLSSIKKGKRGKVSIEIGTLTAAIWLYDEIAIEAKGYSDKGKALGEDWKDKIPVIHKREVIDCFGEVCAHEEEETEKN